MRASALCLSCTLLMPLPAAAQSQVSWTAPKECPSAEQSQREIAQLLGKPLSELDRSVAVSVELRRVSLGELEAKISVRARAQARERVLRDGDCAALMHAAALVVALAIEPRAGLFAVPAARTRPRAPSRRSEPRPAEQDAAVDQLASDATERPSESSARRAPLQSETDDRERSSMSGKGSAQTRASSWPSANRVPDNLSGKGSAQTRESSGLRASLGGASGLIAGVVPDLTPSLSLSVGMLARHFRAALRLTHAFAQRSTLAEPMGVGGRVALSLAGVDAGPYVRLGAFELPLSFGLEAGVFDASGVHVADSRHRQRLWLAGYLGSGLTVAISERLAIGARVEALVALSRPAFGLRSTLGDEYVFHRPERWGARAQLELELRLGPRPN